MKQIKAFIHHCRSTEVLDVLQDAGFKNVALFDVKGTLKPISESELAYSADARVVISEVQITLFCDDEKVKEVTRLIQKNGYVGVNTSGWIYVSPVEQVIAIEKPK